MSLSGCLLLGALFDSGLRFSVDLQLVLAGSPERRQAGIHFVRMRAEIQQLRRGLRAARHRKEVRAGNQAGHVLRQVNNVVKYLIDHFKCTFIYTRIIWIEY